MIIAKTREEIALMRESAHVVSRTLGMLAKEIKPEKKKTQYQVLKVYMIVLLLYLYLQMLK